MEERRVVGLDPWLPWPLTRWPSWTEPVRAERLAAVRIGLAAMLLVDICVTYLPYAGDLFGRGSLGDPEIFAWAGRAPRWNWSLFRDIGDSRLLLGALICWLLAAALLLVGKWSRWSAFVAWAFSVSFLNLNPYAHNAGDTIRTIILFYLMLAPCGAAWSLDSRRSGGGPAHVSPWPVQLLLVQLVLIYFLNGIHKLASPNWLEGEVLYYVLANPLWARWSYAQAPTPYFVTQILTWTVMAWELAFPFLLWLPRARLPALLIGAAFHLGIGVSMVLGMFPWYMLCLYLPLVPWERWVKADTGTVNRGC